MTTSIMPPVFVKLLIDTMANDGNEMRLEEDNFKDYCKADFHELYEMYGESIEMKHSIKTWNDLGCMLIS